MLPVGSIFFPLIIAPFYNVVSSTVQKLIFDDMNTNILRAYVHLLLNV